MKAIVLCAGLGTRLGPLTRDLPKPMLPLDGRPLLEYMLVHLRAQGVEDIAINLHHRPQRIVDHFGDGSGLDLRLVYSQEERLLGTAGALKRLEPWIGADESFLVVYGDLLTDQEIEPLVEAHEAFDSFATLLVHRRPHSNSLVELDDDGRVVAFVERPEPSRSCDSPRYWVNSGMQILSRRIFSRVSPGAVADLPADVYSRVVGEETIVGVPLRGYRCAIDSPRRYAEARRAVADGSFAPILTPST